MTNDDALAAALVEHMADVEETWRDSAETFLREIGMPDEEAGLVALRLANAAAAQLLAEAKRVAPHLLRKN
jgi:hypothetical protein